MEWDQIIPHLNGESWLVSYQVIEYSDVLGYFEYQLVILKYLLQNSTYSYLGSSLIMHVGCLVQKYLV